MVAAFDYCLHGKGGAAPSIDTAMHGLVDAAHVDHLHPDSGIAIATAADGEQLTSKIFGDKVVWVPWRRPGLPAGLGHRQDQGRQPAGDRLRPRRPRHHRVGRHVARSPRPTRWDHRHRSGLHCRALQARAVRPAARRLRRAAGGRAAGQGRCTRADPALHRVLRQADGRPLHRRRRVLEFLASAEHPRLAELGTSCPDHFLRTKVKPLVLDLPADATVEESIARLTRAARGVSRRLPGLLRPQRDADSPAIRGADPLIILVPGVGMFSYGEEQADRPGGR